MKKIQSSHHSPINESLITIFSIDGGGIRGTIARVIFIILEYELQVKISKPKLYMSSANNNYEQHIVPNLVHQTVFHSLEY